MTTVKCETEMSMYEVEKYISLAKSMPEDVQRIMVKHFSPLVVFEEMYNLYEENRQKLEAIKSL